MQRWDIPTNVFIPCFLQQLALLPEDVEGPKSKLESFLLDTEAQVSKKTSYKRKQIQEYNMDIILSEKVITECNAPSQTYTSFDLTAGMFWLAIFRQILL